MHACLLIGLINLPVVPLPFDNVGSINMEACYDVHLRDKG